ncbi:MAG: ATP-binding protein [Rhodobacteraceae bacterium]|nr:ATP-binding protein [Paracoccaceae bacterium]
MTRNILHGTHVLKETEHTGGEESVGTFRSEALKRFVIAGEKSYPPVFVGREDILTEILRKASLGFEQGTAPPGNTRIIQGAPGAGKTSILLELERRGQQGDHAPRTVVVTDVEIEQHLTNVLKSIALAASTPRNAWIETVTQIGSYIGTRPGEISPFGFSADIARLVENSPSADLYDLGTILPASKWVHPVILAVDEAQRLRGETTTPSGHFLKSIHDARQISLPLTLIFAGLGDTKDRISEIGIANGAHAFHVGALEACEQGDVVDGFCDHFGVEMGRQRDRLHAFFEPTEGWPRHIYWAQRALAETLLDPAVEGHLDAIPDWTRIAQRRDRFRMGYCQDRTSFEMERSCKLVGALLEFVALRNRKGQHVTFSDMGDHINQCRRHFKENGLPWVIPEKFGAGNAAVVHHLHHLIHQGALARQDGTGTYVCPIPSFRAYLTEQAHFTANDLRNIDHMMAHT